MYMYISGQLSAPDVEIFDTSFTTFDLRWNNINVAVDDWKVVLLRQTGGSLSVERASKSVFYFTTILNVSDI